MGHFYLSELEGNYFIVKFDDDHDYQNALIGRPWVVFGNYLVVQPWHPSFSLWNVKVEKVFGWIRLPGLPYKSYHKSVLQAIGKVLGEVLGIDYNTELGQKAKFARMMVLINLSKPLTSRIKVDGKTQVVEHEGLQQFATIVVVTAIQKMPQPSETQPPPSHLNPLKKVARENNAHGPWPMDASTET